MIFLSANVSCRIDVAAERRDDRKKEEKQAKC
jgi:hypothetical protein